MDRPHIIEEAEFDFPFRSERHAIELPIELGRYVVNSLLPIVEEVFDSVSGDGDVLRIDSLEIDLGTVRFDELERRFAERLRERLQQLARERAAHREDRDGAPDRLMTTAESDFELLRYFLENGHLPWNAAIRSDDGFEQLIRRVIRSSREDVLRFLRDARDAELVVDRVLSQFPEEVALELLEPLPADATIRGDVDQDVVAAYAVYEEVRAYLVEGRTGSADKLLAAIEMMTRQHSWQGLRLLRELQSGVVLSPYVAHTHGSAMRERVVVALSGVLPDARAGEALVDDVLSRAGWPRDAHDAVLQRDQTAEAAGARLPDLPAKAGSHGLQRDQTVDAAHAQLPDLPAKAGSHGLQRDQTVDAAHARLPDLPAKAGSHGLQGDETVNAAHARLPDLPAKAGSHGSDARAGEEDARQPGEAGRAVATRQLLAWVTETVPWPGDEIVAQTIARLPESLLADVVRQLRPADHRAWLRGVERVVTASYTQGVALPPEQMRHLKWDFLLQAARTAAPHVTAQEIAQRFARVLAEQQITADRTPRIAEFALDEEATRDDEDVVAAYALSDEVRAYLVDGRTESDEALVRAIDALTQQHPWQGLRLLRELQAGLTLSPRVARTYAAPTRQRVIAALQAVLPEDATHETIADDAIAAAGWPRDVEEDQRRRDERRAMKIPDDTIARAEDAAQLEEWMTGASPWPGHEHVAAMIARLADSQLADVVRRLRPADHAAWLRGVERMATASYATPSALAPQALTRIKWNFLLHAAQSSTPRLTERDVAQRFARILAERAGKAGAVESAAALMRQFDRDVHISGEFHGPRVALRVPSQGSSLQRTTTRERGPGNRRQFGDRGTVIHVGNAGVVIAAPYLPRLFAMLNLVDGPMFKHDAAARRAVHLLQFMVDARTDAPEHLLVLNKILCGVPIAMPIERRIDVTEDESGAIEGLIRGMIQNWEKIGRTSVAGFRESFLQRGGTLRRERDEWHLQVEPRAFDMLLDYIPWSFSVIKHPWMPQVVHVEWR